ncbi:MAG TPA: phytoene/squalene synthase family protein [Candidatus Sulfotelmatobacter sp.]|nr:phytoene/squalene synthase family protein [Candidatus Sulfotelmatobacter sp.]
MSAGTQQVPIPWTPAPPQLVMAYSVCRGITREAAKNFYYAFLVLPRRKREALCAVYAFMRRCDDITDDASISLAERRQKLATWLDGLHRAQQGHPTDDPILLALTDAQRRFTIPAGLLDELAHGTAMDVEESSEHAESGSIQYKTFEDLRLYCYRVASVVGLVCIHIFGYRNPDAEPLAENCGLAFQLTNIIRDVKEDAGLGRIYLPEEDLAKFGLSAGELRSTPDPARFRPLLAFEADRAREFYASGEALIPFVSEDSQPGLWVLVNIYRRLLEKIAEKQYDVFTARVSLTRWEKIRILGKGFVKRVT